MFRSRLMAVALVAAAFAVPAVLAAGCAAPHRPSPVAVTVPEPSGAAVEAKAGGTGERRAELPPGRPPTRSFAVGVRRFAFERPDLSRPEGIGREGTDLSRPEGIGRDGTKLRPLPTVVWYPADLDGTDVAPAVGRFPVMILSHGLMGMPEVQLGGLGTRLAAAGFVVIAPTYPYTRPGKQFDRGDIPNQPQDASFVLSQILRLDAADGDLFAGHLDTLRVGAGGFSAGGYTTSGLLSSRRDARVRAAVIIAGGPLGNAAPAGPLTPVLCVHGDADDVVRYSTGRNWYDRLPWPKAFVTVLGKGHGSYLVPGNDGFEQVVGSVVEFLRWALYGDASAKQRLAVVAVKPGVSRYDATF